MRATLDEPEPRESGKRKMAERRDDMAEDTDAIWEGAETLSPSETKDVKVHLTLRLDPTLYRAILTEKKLAGERTVTATVERLLQKAIKGQPSAETGEI